MMAGCVNEVLFYGNLKVIISYLLLLSVVCCRRCLRCPRSTLRPTRKCRVALSV